jgi:maleylacetoacetate isomerase
MRPESAGRLVLYDYWRSSAAYRVRIALNLKGLEYEQRPVNLVQGGGEQHLEAYRDINPQGLVPALLHDGGVITQSLAICNWLEEMFPEPALLPDDPAGRAQVWAMALTIACDIHPINNLRIQQYLNAELGVTAADTANWMNHWMRLGFASLEASLAGGGDSGFCCRGDEPGLADCCLIPQVYNAERFGCDLSGFPVIRRITDHCRSLPAFERAAPERQPDAPGGPIGPPAADKPG